MKTNESVPSIQKDVDPGFNEGTDPVILRTGPEKVSFAFKYLLAFTPIILVFVCITARFVLDIVISAFSTVVDSAINNPAGAIPTNDAFGMNGATSVSPSLMTGLGPLINGISPAVSYGTNIAILMIAPVAIFLIIAGIGWSMRIAEVWTGVALTLVLSGIVGFLLVLMTGSAVAAGQDKFLLYLKWIAFLVQPFSIVATIISLVWLEKFRQSIQYTITETGVTIRGGIWHIQKHLFPHSDVGRIVMEQNFLGTRYNYGTIILVNSTRWGEETSLRGIGAGGQKGAVGAGVMFAKGRQESSRSPLDCLYGIPDPEKAQKILTQYISRHSENEAEQLSYLKKIYEKNTVGMMGGSSSVESIPDLLKKLVELRDAGIITEQEFETKKSELLTRM